MGREAADAKRLARRGQVALAGGQLLGAAFAFVDQLLPARNGSEGPPPLTDAVKLHLAECLETDADGRLKLTVTLPDASALDTLAASFARLREVRA